MEKNFTAPKKEKEFKKYWNLFLPKVTERENFHESHLEQLAILCDMHQEYHNLTQDIKENGYSIVSEGRYGTRSAPRCEVSIRQKTVAEIRAYSKLLGLVLEKDNDKKDAGVKNEWS